MKTITRNQFLKLTPDVRRESFIGYIVRSDNEYDVYERGDATAYAKALKKLQKIEEKEPTPEQKQVVRNDSESEIYIKQLLEGKSLTLKQINTLLRNIYANNLLR